MRKTRSGLLAMVMAVSLVTVAGTVSAELSGASAGTAPDVDKHANKHDAQPKDMQQGTDGQHSGQPKAMDQSANQQGTQQDKASQADLEQGKTAKALEELEQQKPSN